MKRPIYGNDITVYEEHSDMCGCSTCAARYGRGQTGPFFEAKKYEPHEPGYAQAFRNAEYDYELSVQYSD